MGVTFVVSVSCPFCYGNQLTVNMIDKSCDFCGKKFIINHEQSTLVYGNEHLFEWCISRGHFDREKNEFARADEIRAEYIGERLED